MGERSKRDGLKTSSCELGPLCSRGRGQLVADKSGVHPCPLDVKAISEHPRCAQTTSFSMLSILFKPGFSVGLLERLADLFLE